MPLAVNTVPKPSLKVRCHYWIAIWLPGTPATAVLSTQIFVARESLINELAPGIYMCGETQKLTFLWSFWIPILTFEITVFLLVAHKAIKKWGVNILRNSHKPTIGEKLMEVLFYDSFIYFIR
ncbi:hypothetical protein SISNIDRAFT_464839 [Sistotremastrum niveocremeum HHB9708]|uniref:Uncharacterized protein n=1 Tax=Sistotremastrum niveocremeum HHB9708 TaxID=1314777 RepID=A0A164WMP3_9AGAM|nr:hypothetical protein SISNIDRAFT_464839 [Sistotremastrum niveocremeum HHB9708]